MSTNERTVLDWVEESDSTLIAESLRAGLALLWRAYLCSQDTGVNLWEFALRMGRLSEAGMTAGDLRWLLAQGFVEHGQETPNREAPHRSFTPGNGYFFNDLTCVILTARGSALAEHVFPETVRAPRAKQAAFAAGAQTSSPACVVEMAYEKRTTKHSSLKPCWDTSRRELSMAGFIVKRFRVPARNQETILSVFEEEGWAAHIHDPLPITHEIDAPTRLHDAINRLNRCQVHPLLRFHGDGKGTGVFWELSRPDLLS
jgi:hypothetical protein